MATETKRRLLIAYSILLFLTICFFATSALIFIPMMMGLGLPFVALGLFAASASGAATLVSLMVLIEWTKTKLRQLSRDKEYGETSTY